MKLAEEKLTDPRMRPPPLVIPPLTNDPPVKRGERVEEIGAFGAMTGEKGTVLSAGADQAVVKWDGDGKELLNQRYLTKVYDKA